MSESQSLELAVGEVIADRWRVESKLGEGGFGAVYRVTGVASGRECGMKIEPNSEKESMIKMEVVVLKEFQKQKTDRRHVCRYFDSGDTSSFNYVVMQLLGQNLNDLRRRRPGGRFSSSTTVRLGIECLESIEALHRIGFLHRDIKPANFAIGHGDNDRLVYILDFGLGRQYVGRSGRLREARKSVGFRGTVRYASVNAHAKKDLGRHDDLWSLMYVLSEFRRGALPWRKIADTNEVGKRKKETLADELLEGMEPEFHRMLHELQRLQFDSTPNYPFFYDQFKCIMFRKRYEESDPFDWEITCSSQDS